MAGNPAGGVDLAHIGQQHVNVVVGEEITQGVSGGALVFLFQRQILLLAKL
jgi:hypothetical protein